MKNLLMSLNQMFKSDQEIDELVLRITKHLPIDKKYKDFVVQNKDELLHKPSNLIIIRKKNLEKTLQKLYNNNFLINGKSILSVYKYVTKFIANVTISDIEIFLKKQHDYNMTLKQTRKVIKGINEKTNNIRYQVDLIDMGEDFAKANHKYRYILHSIDVFSRYSWIRIMTNRTSLTTSKMMNDIFKEANIYPNILQTDNGSEFMGEFSQLLKNNHIHQIYNESHVPQENGICERGNQTIRKLIGAYMVHKNSKQIYKDMDVIQEAKNKTYMKILNASPYEIWQPNKDTTNRTLPKSIIENNKNLMIRYNQEIRNKKLAEEYKNNDNFKVCDHVYISMRKVFSDIRRKIKANESKDIIIHYLPIKFEIYKMTKGRSVNRRNRYFVRTMDLNYLINPKTLKEVSLDYNDMISFENTHEKEFDISVDRALDLNHSKRSTTDLLFE